MKNSKFAALILIVAITFSANTFAQDFKGLDKSPMDVAPFPADYKESDKKVKVTYSRPQLKNRELSKLAPEGEVWRTGANEAAEITFYYPAKIDGKMVRPGTYSLFTIPGADEWTVILNKKLNQWGSYFYDEASDAARVTVPNVTDATSLEEFSIAFKDVTGGAELVMGWDKTRVAVPITM